MGSSESTKRLTVERSGDDISAGIVTVSERVVRRLRGLEDLPLKGDEDVSQDDINNLWHELQQEKARLKHQHEHFQEFMQSAYDEGRQSEVKKIRENRGTLGDRDAQEIENHWKNVLEEKDAESRTKENKLKEEMNSLRKKLADKEEITVEKFNQAVEETKRKFSHASKVPACQHLKNEVLNCYKQNPTQALKCSQQVRDFLSCVEVSQMLTAGPMELGLQASQSRHVKQGFVPPFQASSRPIQMPPPSPPMLDDILSQMSQRDISSTQLFRSNSEYFDSARNKSFNTSKTVAVSPFEDKRAFPQRSFISQSSQSLHNNWLAGGLQLARTQHSQPSLFIHHETDYGDEEFLQDSPELFTQRTDFHQEHAENSEGRIGLTLNEYEQKDNKIHPSFQAPVPQYNFDTPGQLVIPAFGNDGGSPSSMIGLRSVNEIPNPFRSVFSKFPYFNIVQSKVFDEVMYTDRPMVVCAPTGSGKTVIFELAIIRLLMNSGVGASKAKVVYMAPMKALCSERFMDWKTKFEPFGLKCKEVTGDSELDDYYELQNTHVIMTTPEKWDSMTRKWRDNRSLVQSVRLFLIDEVHLLNDDARGATVEAVISRMKTVQSTMTRSSSDSHDKAGMRLIAISATIPNVEDIAAWLGGIDSPALHYSMDDSYRPVKLRKVVLGFPKGSNFSDFRFDLSLNYKLSGIIQTYSDRKPTLVFCSTRKSAQQAAQTLVKDARFIMNSQHRQRLQRTANSLHDSKLRELVICGIGYHHAGLDPTDRRNIESLFVKGDIPVLFATSTLAVGVNLPAHLVVIKSTAHYVMGVFQEYSETQILQMIGRAGRPQFDTSATAVILTTNAHKEKYTTLLQGTQKLESSLHHHLIEHLNAEIVLNTITDVSIALEWLKSTFLYIRILKNPTYYGIPEGLEKESLEQRLQDLCLKSLNTLESTELIKMDDGFDLKPTEAGRLMARYCIAYDSMKQFLQIKGKESLSDLVELVSKCKEFSDVKLRVTEKKVLNGLNKDKNKQTIRFPINGRIKTTDQKVNCLIQATLGSLIISDFALSQDATKIFRAGQRITRCLTELQMLKTDFTSLQNSVILSKCMRARLWENSKFVSRQLEKIGPSLSTMLVNAGLTTFKKIEDTNPREIEMIVNRHPPFGNQIREATSNLPKFELSIQQTGRQQPNRAEIVVTVTMTNYIKRREAMGSGRNNHFCILLIADADNRVVFKQRLGDAIFMKEGYWSKRVDVERAPVQSSELSINLISQEYVGLDVSTTYSPHYSGFHSYFIMKREPRASSSKSVGRVAPNTVSAENKGGTTSKADAPRVPCSHRCFSKEICGHDCCKQGIISKTKKKKSEIEQGKEPKQTTSRKDLTLRLNVECEEQNCMDSFLRNLHQRTQAIPGTPAAKRLKMSTPETEGTNFVDLTLTERFGYTRKTPVKHQKESCRVKSEVEDSATKRVPERSCWEEIDWHKSRMEEQQEASLDVKNYDNFDDEMPCFSVDELWNDDDLALCLNDESDQFSSPAVQYPQQKEQDISHAHYFKPTAPGRCQTDAFEVKRPLSRSPHFIVGSQVKLANSAPNTVVSRQFKGKPRRISCPLAAPPSTPGEDDFQMANHLRNSGRISHPLPPPPATPGAHDFEMTNHFRNPKRISRVWPPPPPTPGAKDFETKNHLASNKRISPILPPPPPIPSANDYEMTIHTGFARRPCSDQWINQGEGRVNRINTGTSHQNDKRSLPPDEFEAEDWGILPVVTTTTWNERKTSRVSQKVHNPTNLTSVSRMTNLDPLVLQEIGEKRDTDLKANRILGNKEDFSANGCIQSFIPSSFSVPNRSRGVSKIARNKMPLWESSLDGYSEKRKEKKVHAERK